MTNHQQFFIDQPTQQITALSGKEETQKERMARLKQIADATGRKFFQVYQEDERRREGNQ